MRVPSKTAISVRLIPIIVAALFLSACSQQSKNSNGAAVSADGAKRLEGVGGAREGEDAASGSASTAGTARFADEDMVTDDRLAASEVRPQYQAQPAPQIQPKPEPPVVAEKPIAKPENPKPKATKPAAKGQKTYVVQRGDSLWKIAQKQYGDGRAWRKIYNANRGRISDPSDVPIGTKLVIP